MDRFTSWVYSVISPAPMRKQAKGPDALATWMRKQAELEGFMKPEDSPYYQAYVPKQKPQEQSSQPAPEKNYAVQTVDDTDYLTPALGMLKPYEDIVQFDAKPGYSPYKILSTGRENMLAKAKDEWNKVTKGTGATPSDEQLTRFMNRGSNGRWGNALYALDRELDRYRIQDSKDAVQQDWYLGTRLANGVLKPKGLQKDVLTRAAQNAQLKYDESTESMPWYKRLAVSSWGSDPSDSFMSTTRRPKAEAMEALEKKVQGYADRTGGSLLAGNGYMDNRNGVGAGVDLSNLSKEEQEDYLSSAILLSKLRVHDQWDKHVTSVEAAPWAGLASGLSRVRFGKDLTRDNGNLYEGYDERLNRILYEGENFAGATIRNLAQSMVDPKHAAEGYMDIAVQGARFGNEALGGNKTVDDTLDYLSSYTNPNWDVAGGVLGHVIPGAEKIMPRISRTAQIAVPTLQILDNTARQGMTSSAVMNIRDIDKNPNASSMLHSLAPSALYGEAGVETAPRVSVTTLKHADGTPFSPQEQYDALMQISDQRFQDVYEPWSQQMAFIRYAGANGLDPAALTDQQKQQALDSVTDEQMLNDIVSIQSSLVDDGYAVNPAVLQDPNVPLDKKTHIMGSVIVSKIGQGIRDEYGDTTTTSGVIAQFGEGTGAGAGIHGRLNGDNKLDNAGNRKLYIQDSIKELALKHDPEVETMMTSYADSVGRTLGDRLLTEDELSKFAGTSSIDVGGEQLTAVDMLNAMPRETLYKMMSSAASEGNTDSGDKMSNIVHNLMAMTKAGGSVDNLFKQCPNVTDVTCQVIRESLSRDAYNTGRFAGLIQDLQGSGALDDHALKQAFIDGVAKLDGEQFAKGLSSSMTWESILERYNAGQHGKVSDSEYLSGMPEDQRAKIDGIVQKEGQSIVLKHMATHPQDMHKVVSMFFGMNNCPQLAEFCKNPIKFYGTLIGILGIGALLLSDDDDDDDDEDEKSPGIDYEAIGRSVIGR